MSQCDGLRPECSSCKKRGDGCAYDFEVGSDTTRYQALRKRQTELEQLYGQSVEVLEQLRNRPRSEAMAIFEQIRRGDSLDELLKVVKDGDLLIELASNTSKISSASPTNSIGHEGVVLPPLRLAVPEVHREFESNPQQRPSREAFSPPGQ